MPGPKHAREARALTEVITRLRRALRSSVRTDIAWEKLPMAQVELLQSLTEDSPARVSDLAERLHLAPSTVSGLISQMLAADLVERGTDPDDRRAAIVEIASKGREELASWETANERRVIAALTKLTAEERSDIAAALPALRHLAGKLGESQQPSNR